MRSISRVDTDHKIKKPGIIWGSQEKIWEVIGITAILFLAALLRFSNLDSLGYVNHYYTAGVESMLQSWHNFFFVAAEPGGSVTIDKPPVGLWLQVISAYFLGVNGFSVLLPQLLAGTISVAILYHLVRRSFGVLPGLLAALVLAITPIVVATDRNNTIDSTLILTLLLASWAFVKATETGRLLFLLLGAALVGIGFNIKMLQAYLPLPAFYAMYFLGSSEIMRRKIAKLALATVLLLTISLSWAIAVDLTPAEQRPYIGSSSDNSELDLIVGYNGAQRLLGALRRDGSQGDGAGQLPGNPPLFRPDGDNSSGNNPPSDGSQVPPNQADANGQQYGSPPGDRGGGFNIGQPSVFRLFTSPLNKEVSWLLPFGLVSILLLAASSHWTCPVAPRHQALVLWGLWLITCSVFFSVAGFFHEYYLSTLGAPLAALVAIGVNELWNMTKERRLAAGSILIATGLGTVGFQIFTATTFTSDIWWLPMIVVVLAFAVIALIYGMIDSNKMLSLRTGFSLMVLAFLLTPGIWSVYTTLSASQNQSLPSSYSGAAVGDVIQRDLQINQPLLDYLQANTNDMKYLMAVPSSMQGADYVLATGRPVLYMGGFNGQDDVVSSEDLSLMVKNGELRYIYWSADDRGPGGTNSEISSWVTSSCSIVPGFNTSTQNAGAPDGTTQDQNKRTSQTMDGGGVFRNMQVTLYDCATRN